MKIGHKVMSGVVVMSAFIALVGGYSLSQHYDSIRQIDQIINTNSREIEQAEKIDSAIQELEFYYIQWLFESQTGKHLADIASASDGVRQSFLKINKSLDTLESVSRQQMVGIHEVGEKEEIDQINVLKSKMSQFKAVSERYAQLLNRGSYVQAHLLFDDTIAPSIRDVLTISADLKVDASNEMKMALDSAKDDSEASIAITIQLVAGVLLVAMLFGLLLSRRITTNIDKLKHVTAQIGEGKLDSRVDLLSGDELGDIARSINSMAEGLREAIVSRDDLAREISERKQMEDKLAKSEQKFRTIFEGTGEPFILLDREHLIDCNRASLSMFGCSSRDQLLGLSYAELSSPTQFDGDSSNVAADKIVDEALKIGSSFFEWKYRKVSGEEFLAEVLLTIISIDGKDFLLASMRDISERKRAEKALMQSEERIRLLLDSTAEAIYGIDSEGLCFLANSACMKMLGYERFSELKGKQMHELIHHSRVDGSPYPIDECPVYQALETGKEAHVDDEVIWRKNGSFFPASYWTHPIYKGDKIAGSVVTFLDITDTIKTKQDLKQSHEYLRVSLEGTVSAVAKAVEARDPYTSGHQNRVAEIAVAIAHEMGLDSDRIKGIYLGAIIHDIGKIQTPAELLSKPSRLTEIEYSLIQTHAQTGYEILKDVAFPWPIALIAQQHHERVDGSGYPHGLKGEEICLEARIVAVADVVEAMSNHRPYRAGLGIDRALDEIRTNRGTHYDADVADACLSLFTTKGFSVQTS